MGSLRSLLNHRDTPRWLEVYLETGWIAGPRWCCYDFTTVPGQDLDQAREKMKNREPALRYSHILEVPDEYDLGYYLAWFKDRWGVHGSVRNIKDPTWRHWES